MAPKTAQLGTVLELLPCTLLQQADQFIQLKTRYGQRPAPRPILPAARATASNSARD